MKTGFLLLALSAIWISLPLDAVAQNNSKQATEAAQKHRAQSSVGNTQTQKPAAKPSGSVANRLQACKSAAGMNVIEREKCVWSMCKGRWGKDGCPAESKVPPPDRR